MPFDAATARWFLTPGERGNPDTRLQRVEDEQAWTIGNEVLPIVHGAPYFARLCEQVQRLTSGDQLFFTDWRGDSDERLGPE